MFVDDATKELLNKPIDPSIVSSRREGHGQVSYLETWKAIDTANRVFNYEWSFEIIEVKEVWNGSIKDRLEVAYLCKGKVTVGDVVHSDVGFGTGMDKNGNLGACHELASKEAVSDCIKRCLRNFGAQFGNSLYDKKKEWQNEEPAQDTPPLPPAEPRASTPKTLFADSVKSLHENDKSGPVSKEDWVHYIRKCGQKIDKPVLDVAAIPEDSPLWSELSDGAAQIFNEKVASNAVPGNN